MSVMVDMAQALSLELILQRLTTRRALRPLRVPSVTAAVNETREGTYEAVGRAIDQVVNQHRIFTTVAVR